MTPELEAVLTVLFGALAGGLTNSVAIWMLFHPYHPPRLFGRAVTPLQGAIPKNKDRLAAAIGRTVGTRLLTGEDLARALSEKAFRDAFEMRLETFLSDLLERERGPIGEMLPPAVRTEVEALLDTVAGELEGRIARYAGSDAFRDSVHAWALRLAAEVENRPIGELLTQDRESALTEAAQDWLGEAVGGPGFERTVDDYLERTADRLLRPDRTFQDLLPVGLVASVERAIAGYLPLVLEQLGTLMEDPDARQKAESFLHDLLERFLRDLNFYKRVVAALIIPPDTVDRVLDVIEQEGAARLTEMLQDDAVRDAMARSVNDAIVEFLRRPVVSVLGEREDETVQEVMGTVAGWVLNVARDPHTSEFLVDKLRTTLETAQDATWGDLFRRLPPERIAAGLIDVAQSPEAASIYRDGVSRGTRLLLERPIGRPADLLGPDAVTRLRDAMKDPLWDWIQEQVPTVATQLDIAGKVEQKIMEFPMERLEELIRGVTQRELKLIVRLGYLLGAVIGSALVTLNLLT